MSERPTSSRPEQPHLSPLAQLILDRDENREEVLWGALMRCHECDDLIVEHDQVAFRCRVCSCNQEHRGLSAYADEFLMELGMALKEADR